MQLAILGSIEVQKVVTLQQLIGKFGERKAVSGFAVQAFLHAVLSHHVVDGDVFTYGSGEIKEGEVFHPVVVVHHLGGIGLRSVEVKELCDLCFDAFLIVIEGLSIQKISLLALSRRVSYHAGSTSYEDNRFVSAML